MTLYPNRQPGRIPRPHPLPKQPRTALVKRNRKDKP